MDNNAQRIPSLDGCRAIAIISVLYWHLWFAAHNTFPKVSVDWGTLGVYVFFVLSGFLITTILKREREQYGTISLKNFYIRRVFRIFPPLLFFLAGLLVFRELGLSYISRGELLFSLTFLRNYHPGRYTNVHHLWSLSVEEQFYLLWPFLFCFLSERKVSRLLLAVIVGAPLIRIGMLLRFGHTLPWQFEEVADGLAVGCLLAIKQKNLRANRVYQWISQSYIALLLPGIAIVGAYTAPDFLYEGVGKTATFLSVALAMDIVMLRWNSPAGTVLNWAPLVALGKISYSLYLWQQLFVLVHYGEQPYAWFPMNVVLALVAATISYFCIEQPAIRFGRDVISRRARRNVAAPIVATSGDAQRRLAVQTSEESPGDLQR